MKKLVRYQLADGNDVLIEVDDPQADSIEMAGAVGDVIANANQKLEDVLSNIKPGVSAVVRALRDLAADEAAVEFGVKLNMNSGVIFTSAGVEANFVVKLTWKHKSDAPQP